jgi:hypothetical protein
VIHDEILKKVQEVLQEHLIDDIEYDDEALVGIVKLGDLQGEPDPDIARISVTIHENDPDKFVSGALTSQYGVWDDEVYEVEVGGVTTYRRRFTVKARCLLDLSKEELDMARRITSTVRSRIENILLSISFDGITYEGERVSKTILGSAMHGEVFQSGGPPDSFDFFIKIRFELLTTK